MRKSIWIFLLAVLLPSIVLGVLAVRGVEEQQIVLEKRTAKLYQTETDDAARTARALIDDERQAFNNAVRRLLASGNAQLVANNFTADLTKEWPRKAIGFAIGQEGQLCAPSPQRAAGNADLSKFLIGNGGWLAGTTPATVYWMSGQDLNRSDQVRVKGKTGTYEANGPAGYNNYTGNTAVKGGNLTFNQGSNDNTDSQRANGPAASNNIANLPVVQAAQGQQNAPDEQYINAKPLFPNAEPKVTQQALTGKEQMEQPPSKDEQKLQAANPNNDNSANPVPLDNGTQFKIIVNNKLEASARQVAPQQALNKGVVLSQLVPATADFRALTADTNEGVITRFVQDQLDIIFWLRPAQTPDMVFGCLIESNDLRDLWPAVLPGRQADDSLRLSRSDKPEFILALLDDKARPVVTQPPSETERDWKRPFVATEIGEALPHWEAALYLQRPEQVHESAIALQRTLIFLVATALGAIACGGWLVVADARRQLALAQQKTDFVSNVSHELKTPLTSIRMFAELMHSGRGAAAEKYPQYLRIIMVEAERLTRLINNVLDFARLERRQKRFEKKPMDLHAVIARTWEGHELHLRESGFTTRWQATAGPYPVVGDEDALAQILVNLLSNAEKYCGERKEVELHTYLDGGHAYISVLDRGSGVQAGEERKIFEAFYRAHDSLSSGIQGSGLGLTLAQRLAHENDGEITVAPREGGGSNFTLRVPLAKRSDA